jgi:anti-anti-sigma factor
MKIMEIKRVKDVLLFVVKEEFTGNNFAERLAVIREAIDSKKSVKFMVDLSKCKRINSFTLGSMVVINKSILAQTGKFGVIVKDEDSMNAFHLTGLNKLFPIYLNEEHAETSF